jgi:undecaprenyl-diphosphatase
LTPGDRHLERWIVHHRAGWLNWLFEGLSRAGTFGAIWILIAFLLGLAWRRWGMFIVTAAAVAIADLAATALKAVVDVERPSSRYATPKTLVPAPRDHSFPSGHTATSFAAAVVLTAFAPRFAPLWFLLAVAIGFARVYVGVHYPLDIAGGAAVGIVTALLLLAAARRRSRAGTQSVR